MTTWRPRWLNQLPLPDNNSRPPTSNPKLSPNPRHNRNSSQRPTHSQATTQLVQTSRRQSSKSQLPRNNQQQIMPSPLTTMRAGITTTTVETVEMERRVLEVAAKDPPSSEQWERMGGFCRRPSRKRPPERTHTRERHAHAYTKIYTNTNCNLVILLCYRPESISKV